MGGPISAISDTGVEREWFAWICSTSPGSSPQQPHTHLGVFSRLGSSHTSNLVSHYMLWRKTLTHMDP